LRVYIDTEAGVEYVFVYLHLEGLNTPYIMPVQVAGVDKSQKYLLPVLLQAFATGSTIDITYKDSWGVNG